MAHQIPRPLSHWAPRFTRADVALGQTARVNARSALFDVYGDHLRTRGGAAPVAVLVRLLSSLDVAPPATRTAVSRMVRQGWLEPVRLGAGPGYRLTPAAARRLSASADRIYRRQREWDGRWHLLVAERPADRRARDRMRSGLEFLGYAPLADTTWISPRGSDEVDALLSGLGVAAWSFLAAGERDDGSLATTAWDLDALGERYRQWLAEAAEIVRDDPADDEQAFRVRSTLVHEWRKFLFRDPLLPAELLPPDWPGHTAAALFDTHADRLAPAAARFVDQCLEASPGRDA